MTENPFNRLFDAEQSRTIRVRQEQHRLHEASTRLRQERQDKTTADARRREIDKRLGTIADDISLLDDVQKN